MSDIMSIRLRCVYISVLLVLSCGGEATPDPVTDSLADVSGDAVTDSSRAVLPLEVRVTLDG